MDSPITWQAKQSIYKEIDTSHNCEPENQDKLGSSLFAEMEYICATPSWQLSCYPNESLKSCENESKHRHLRFVMHHDRSTPYTSLRKGSHLIFNPGRKLLIAAISNNTERLKYLLDKGAPVNITNNEGKSALHIAAQGKFIKMTHLLLTHGANVDSRDNQGRTPLHVAVYWSNVEIVKLLLSAGANVFALDNYGHDINYLAEERMAISSRSKIPEIIDSISINNTKILNMIMEHVKRIEELGKQVEHLTNVCSRLSLSKKT